MAAILDYALNYPIILGVAGLLLFPLLARYYIARAGRLRLPVLDMSEYENEKDALVGASLKYHDTPFILPTDPPTIILPIHMMDEVKNLPEDKASFLKELRRIFVYESTGIGEDRPELLATVRVDLTKNIPASIRMLQEETRYGFEKELGPCEQWTTVQLYPKLVRMVALLSGRIFVGRPLSRNEEWLESSVQYSIDCDGARRALMRYPSYMRRIVAPFLPELRRLKVHKTRGGKLLEPTFKQCRERYGREKVPFNDTEQGNVMSWIFGHLEGAQASSITQLTMANYQMMLSFAAIHTTTSSACHALYDLMARPEYIQLLRDEIEEVIAEDGHDVDEDGNTQLMKGSLIKLKKLDSFLKESQRENPLSLVNMIRGSNSPITLSSGHTLPTGSRFAFNLHGANNCASNPASNPAISKPTDQFDGLRFFNLRSMPGNENRHQYVSTGTDSFAFGHGLHACPGRFFAGVEIKIVMIELLRYWEFELVGDGKRPANVEFQFGISPNAEAEVRFRRRVL